MSRERRLASGRVRGSHKLEDCGVEFPGDAAARIERRESGAQHLAPDLGRLRRVRWKENFIVAMPQRAERSHLGEGPVSNLVAVESAGAGERKQRLKATKRKPLPREVSVC